MYSFPARLWVLPWGGFREITNRSTSKGCVFGLCAAADTQGSLGSPWPLCLKRGWGINVLYAPLAVKRLVAAVCVFRPTRRSLIEGRGCQGCGAPSAVRPGLDAGASGDYLAWPSQDGKPQRPAVGQGSGPERRPSPEVSETRPGHGAPATAPVSAAYSLAVKDRSSYDQERSASAAMGRAPWRG